jgi:hypothetical protein
MKDDVKRRLDSCVCDFRERTVPPSHTSHPVYFHIVILGQGPMNSLPRMISNHDPHGLPSQVLGLA